MKRSLPNELLTRKLFTYIRIRLFHLPHPGCELLLEQLQRRLAIEHAAADVHVPRSIAPNFEAEELEAKVHRVCGWIRIWNNI